jgi:protein-tyrosine phosphatase
MKKKVLDLITRISTRHERGTIRSIPVRTPGRLWVSPMPFGAYDKGNHLLARYRQHGIQHVFILVNDAEIKTKTGRDLKAIYKKAGISFTQYPFLDMQAPNLPMLQEMVKTAVMVLEDHDVAIHCHAGVGRTSIGACCVVQAVEGMSPAESITYVKQHMEVNMTSEQQALVMRFRAG